MSAKRRPGVGAAAAGVPLEDLSLDVLVRDFPETLAWLRAAGVDLAVDGLASLKRRGMSEDALAELRARIAWRDA